ncbi:MAG: AMP-binding protein [Planctomycetes bacterium]|jgi:long-chain acyl-CoA synthetase|nr:AMP-binding protein [Planctomycetota bacterium]
MRWNPFSRKKDEAAAPKKTPWRLLVQPAGDAADVYAFPGAVLEGRTAGRYLLSGAGSRPTAILQAPGKPGLLVGAEVSVDEEAAAARGLQVARMPRSGRGGAFPAGARSLDRILLEEKDALPARDNADGDTAVILYTSGTAGRPKGVVLTHGNFLADCSLFDQLCPIRSDDRIVAVLPLFHIFGLTNVLLGALYHGAAAALVPQYSPSNLLQALADTRATALLATPTMIVHLVKAQKRRKLPLPGTLRFCISGAAPLPVETIAEFEETFGAPLFEGYGLTESTSAAALNTKARERPGAVGKLPDGIEARIVDDTGNALPPCATGEIALRGPTVTKGYYNLPEETAAAFRDGWFLTGDIGYVDAEGLLRITDRKKDLIVKGGFKIPPKEIEEVLLGNPAVREAAVIGIRREEREAIKAFVVCRKGTTEAELLAYCQEKMAAFKVPNVFEFREALPKSMTGKVLKKELRDGFVDDRLMPGCAGPATEGGGMGNGS